LNAALWVSVSVLVLSLGLAYSIIFNEVTLALGRTLSETQVGPGYQAALTPPWAARLAVLVLLMMLALICVSWYEFGAARGIATVLALFAGSWVWRRMLPKAHSTHYLRLIVVSMTRRYADWVRAGDKVRAAAMRELIGKMGLQVPGVPGADTSAS
jgi:hypothetical protein